MSHPTAKERDVQKRFSPILTCSMLAGLAAISVAAHSEAKPETVDARHPGLTFGVLTFARLADLPEGVLLRCGSVAITAAALDEIRSIQYGFSDEELKRNALFLLEREATPRLLLLLARKADGGDGKKSERELIDSYLDRVTAQVRVADAEIARFYDENGQLFGGATLEAMKEPIRRHLLEAKKEDAIGEHVRTLGQRLKIEVSSAWVDEQAPLAMDNPADKARHNGKPTLIAFSGPCG